MILVINLNFQDDQFTLVIQSSGSIDNPFLSGAILAVAQNGLALKLCQIGSQAVSGMLC